jgi:hypothetical protein
MKLSQNSTPATLVPDDFPRDPFPAAISGAQPKVALQLIEGKYIAGLTDEEREERYLYCADIVAQLIPYVTRKQAELPQLSLAELLEQIDAGIRRKDWDLSKVELDWMMLRIREHFPI